MPGKLPLAMFPAKGDAEPKSLTLCRMLVKPTPPGKPFWLTSEYSADSDSPGTDSGLNAMLSDFVSALLGWRLGLFPSSPCRPGFARPNTVWITPLPTSRVSVGPYSAKSVGAVNDLE